MILALRPLFTATIAASLLLSSAGLVHAQTAEERAGARAAAEAGADAFDAGRYEEAVELFRRAEAVVHATPHLLYIARAQSKLGRLVEAREGYLAIINESLPPRAHPVLVQTRKDAEQELDQLEPRIPQITVVVQGGKTEGLQVFMDEREVPSALVGIPRPVNPGAHEFYATALGSESSRNTVTIKEGGQETVMLTLRPTQAAAEPAPAAATPAATASTSDGGTNGRQIAAYSALGVGAIGIGVGALFFAQANTLSNDADGIFQACNPSPDRCTAAQQQEIEDLDKDAGSTRALSFVGFGVGALGIATGVTLLLLNDSSSETAALKPGVRPWVGLGSAGVTGRF